MVGRRRGARGGGLFGGGYVSLFIPCRSCGGSNGVCLHGHTSWLGVRGHFACVSWCGVPFFFLLCGALRLDGLFPLSLSPTLLVPWLPRPMHEGDSSECALLLLVAWRLCPFPRELTSAPFRRVAAWRIV